MKRMLILVGAVFLATAAAARAEDCMECHYGGKDKKAPIISVLGNSAHAGLSCSECHPGDDFPPCPPQTPPVKCTMCHEDQVKAVGSSSHGKKMQTYIKDQTGEVKLQDICMSCHGKDIHHLRQKSDALSPVNRTNVYKTCLTCHDKVQPIAIDGYIDSIHGVAASGGNLRSAVCTDCHGSHFIEGMGLSDSSVFYATIPETCGKCHPKEYSEYVDSKHWKTVQNGYREAPVCTNCHGEHNIRSRRDPMSPSWVGNITQTCGSCHQSEVINAKFMMPKGMVKSFLDSYHGLSGTLGDVRVANCASCHGNHAILPSSDPRSTVNPKNLGKTCGGCHPGAEKRFIYEPIHKIAKTESHWIVGLVKNIYILLIIGTIGGMLAHNLFDLFYKSTKGVPYQKEQLFDPRLTGNERIQHALLTLSFICLAVSGFALSFPDSLIAQPFQWITTGADVRRWIHRGAAAVFGAVSLYHLLYLALTARGRAQLQALKPGFADVKNAWAVMMKYLGRNPDPLTLPHYGYVEKAEYWALIWGGVVMSITGVVLLLTDFILAFMPLWVVNLADTIHFLEAVLAVSAIIVWHGYWVIFDPEYYPINLTFLFGRPRRLKKEG
ncbi:MAG TPA: cytochrome b/b6 domain-containing protein [bacterium]|nr:cytochrome b/b6 domain-containing protein [bacterium]